VAQSTKFLISTPTKPKRSLCNSSNDQYQGNGFAADVLLGPKSRTNRSHRKRSYSISNIGNMMGCDYLSWSQSVHWQASYGISNIFQQRPSAILKFKNFNIILITWLSLLSEFAVVYQISAKLVHAFGLQSPDAHNCWMSSAPLLGNGRCHGNRIMADMSGTWWDATSQSQR